MFLRNAWYCAAESGEIGRAPFGRVFLNEPVVLYRKEDGAPVALADQCCHRRAPLHKGRLEGDRIRCGYHGFLYDPTGVCVWVPGQSQPPPEARVRAYPVIERHGWVWIWMGEASRADPDLVPDFHENADSAWASVGAWLPVAADYLLLVDNLLDLSHVAFLHAKTIGSPEDTDPDLAWERGERWVRGTRVVRNISAPERFRVEGITCNLDQTKVMTWTPPANVAIDIVTTETGFKPGAGGRCQQRFFIFDSMTPETETTCHYFWSNARNYAIDDAGYSAAVKRMVATAFDEDKDMLEGQQRNIGRGRGGRTVDVAGDAGGLQARRLLDRLIAAEAGVRAAAE
jgi:vanillate O-demethylase monooxygenase subunit